MTQNIENPKKFTKKKKNTIRTNKQDQQGCRMQYQYWKNQFIYTLAEIDLKIKLKKQFYNCIKK